MATLRELLASTGWLERTRAFARGLRKATRTPGGLLLVGTPDDEPWHLAAHLDEESRLAAIPELMPTLVRWRVPAHGPAHLRVGLERLEAARRGETLFVVTPTTAPVPLLERISDARRSGATIFALDQGDRELDSLAHETMAIRPGAGAPVLSFGVAQHLVSAACGELGERGAAAGGEFGVARQPSRAGQASRTRVPALPAGRPRAEGPRGAPAGGGQRAQSLSLRLRRPGSGPSWGAR